MLVLWSSLAVSQATAPTSSGSAANTARSNARSPLASTPGSRRLPDGTLTVRSKNRRIGSIFSTVYVNSLRTGTGTAFAALPVGARTATEQSVVAAGGVARQLGTNATPFLLEVNNAFLDGLRIACIVVAGVAIVGALFALRFLPARPGELTPRRRR